MHEDEQDTELLSEVRIQGKKAVYREILTLRREVILKTHERQYVKDM